MIVFMNGVCLINIQVEIIPNNPVINLIITDSRFLKEYFFFNESFCFKIKIVTSILQEGIIFIFVLAH